MTAGVERARWRLTRRQAWALGLVVAFALLPPLLARNAPWVLTDFRALVLTVGVTFGAMALSLNLLMGYAGQISLGHAALVGVGAYTSGILTGRLELPFLLAVPAVVIFGGLIALIAGLPALRLRGLYLAITTVGLLFVMTDSIFQLPAISRGSAGVRLPRPNIFGIELTTNADFLALVLVVTLLLWLLDANVVRTRLGRALNAIREDENVAQSFGIDTARTKLIAFVLSGSFAAVAGLLLGHRLGFVNSSVFNYRTSLFLVALVVVGGLGSRVGVFTAGIIFGIAPQLLKFIEGWDFVVGSALLVYAMARHPGGVAGILREAREAKELRKLRSGAVDEDADEAVPMLPALLPGSGAASANGAGRPVLEARDVHVRFGGLRAVDGASLAVPRNKIVGLIGPNGAGKTTLFNAVSGFVSMEQGSITFLGTELRGLPAHHRAALGIGRTFQLVGLARTLSVMENLLLAQHPLGTYGTLRALVYSPRAGANETVLIERAREAIAALGFERYADTPIRNLSGGQQRIVEMACALVTAPDMMMLDEPSAGMAPAVVESLAQRLRDLRDQVGRTVLLIEHHIPLVLDVCDEIYVLNMGRILAHGTPEEIVARQDVIDAYLGGSLTDIEEVRA